MPASALPQEALPREALPQDAPVHDAPARDAPLREAPAQARARLARLEPLVRPVTLAGVRVLPVIETVAPLLPHAGVRRGSTVWVSGPMGSGVTSVALALAAGPSQAGSWVGAVDLPELGLAAADEAGVVLERLAVVDTRSAPPQPGDDDERRSRWASAVSALVDAFDVVLLGPAPARTAGIRRLAARCRERGCVVIRVGGSDWPVAADVRWEVRTLAWSGLDDGHGRLLRRRLRVDADGRGAAARSRSVVMELPAGDRS